MCLADTAEPVADTAKLAALPNIVVSRVESTAEAAGVANIAGTGRIAAGVCSSHVAAVFGQEQKAAEQEMADIAPAWRIVG